MLHICLCTDRCSHMVSGLICHELKWCFSRAITSPLHVNVGQQRQPWPPQVLLASQGHQPYPNRGSGMEQTRLAPPGPFSWITQAVILITDKAIKRLPIQRSPGQKTTAAGEPPSTSANAFAACTGRHPTAQLSAQGKHALTPCQLPKQALTSHREPTVPPSAYNATKLTTPMQFNWLLQGLFSRWVF